MRTELSRTWPARPPSRSPQFIPPNFTTGLPSPAGAPCSAIQPDHLQPAAHASGKSPQGRTSSADPATPARAGQPLATALVLQAPRPACKQLGTDKHLAPLRSSFLHPRLVPPRKLLTPSYPRSRDQAGGVCSVPSGKDTGMPGPGAVKPGDFGADMGSPAEVVEEPGEALDAPAGEGTADQVKRYLEGLMPKTEIGAKRFLEKYPLADGRGTVIAIFDSGVDPGAAGLQTTPQGQPKIIDCIDCSGSGDVDTSKVVKADTEGCITGASGRRLRVNKAWVNPSGEWRVGAKRAFDLFNDSLLERVKSERKKHWDEKHHELLTAAHRELAAYDAKHPKGEWADDGVKKQYEELQARVDVLHSLAQDFSDPGPTVDAVVWHAGDVWRVALDTSDFYAPFMPLPPAWGNRGEGQPVTEGDAKGREKGKSPGLLEDFEPLADYSLEQRYATFSALDMCNYAVKVYDEGALLSIVTECSSHGTHVAGIAAAYHPEEPALNGIAPGAQIISCKIGDTRLASMETTTGIVRALIAAVQNKCDLINMSYGEPISLTDTGRVIELANEVVHKHGIVFVSSAGNQGPALSTVLAPGGTSTGVIGVGAYVSQSLAAFGHSVIDPSYLEDGTQYTWSSRGPAFDGALGVCVSAPGGAVAPVPTSSLQRRQLMNGTSMASPCACGGIALLLSKLKADLKRRQEEGGGVPLPAWGPSLVRQAVENSALPLSPDAADTLTFGRGLLQVDRAYEYLQKSLAGPAYLAGLRYAVSVSNTRSGAQQRGIYLRESHESNTPSEWQVFVSPNFEEHLGGKNSDKACFEERVRLVATKPLPAPGAGGAGGGGAESVPWIKVPEFVLLAHSGRSFNVRVDPTLLPPGSLEYAEVCGLDLERPWRGPIFRIPVTVIRPMPPAPPQPPQALVLGLGTPLPVAARGRTMHVVKIAPGHVSRVFLEVPSGATWAEISLRLSSVPTPIMLLSNTMQVLPQRRYTYRNVRSYLKFVSPSTRSLSCVVEGGSTLELALAQMWSSGSGGPQHPHAQAEAEVEFHGLATVHGDVFLNGNSAIQRVEVAAPPELNAERLSPSISLNRLRTAHRPSDSKIEPMSGPRDTLPNTRQIHSLLLTYKFSVSEAGRYTPRFPLLNQRLYDNEYEGQFYIICDSNKMLLSQEDCYPKSVRLGKGDYVLRLMVRHDKTAYLEKLRKMPLLLDRTLDDKSSVKLSLYSSVDSALTGSDATFKSSLIFPGERKPLFLTGPADDRLPKDASPGSLLLGRATLSKLGGPGSNSDSSAPSRLSVTYLVPQSAKVDDKKNGGVVPQAVPVGEKVKDQLRDSKVKALSTAASEKDKAVELVTRMADELKSEYPGHLPLLLEILKFWDDPKVREKHLPKVVEAADDIVAAVDRTSLALHLAMKTEPEASAYLKERKEREAERDALVDALYRKGLALADLEEQARKGAKESGAAAPDTYDTARTSPPAGAESSSGNGGVAEERVPAAVVGSEEEAAVFQPVVVAASAGQGTTLEGTGSSSAISFGSFGFFSPASAESAQESVASEDSDTRTGSQGADPQGAGPNPSGSAGTTGPGGANGEETASGGEPEHAAAPGPSSNGGDKPAALAESGKASRGAAGGEDMFEENFAEFRRWADPSAPKHALLQVVRERRAGRTGLALKALLKMLEDDAKAQDKKLHELRVALLTEAGWSLWADLHSAWNWVRFPSAYPPF